MYYVIGYLVLIAVFLICWKRWGDRMEQLDVIEAKMFREMQDGKQ